MVNTQNADEREKLEMSAEQRLKRAGTGILVIAWWCGALFGGAGTLSWVRGWICTVLYLGGTIVVPVVIIKVNPGLQERREARIHSGTKAFDKTFLCAFLPLAIALPAVAGLDSVRFAWYPMPFWTLYPGLGLFVVSTAIIVWVMVSNPHAETTVRIQDERGHAVISGGPYRFVRHPMYVGLILLYFSQALILGSTLALLIAVVVAVLFFWRTGMEDRVLRNELPGYEEYSGFTRFRLIPGVW
jgi:protein-S-isoprenylcysteine O-methyltransferase Ste14